MWRTFTPFTDGRSRLPVDVREEPLPSDEAGRGDVPAGELPSMGSMAAPDLRGLSAQNARRLARLAELHVEIAEHAAVSGMRGRVLTQRPDPGVDVEPGSVISIVVCSEPRVAVPDVRGVEESDSLSLLREAGLIPDRRSVRRSDRFSQGHVVRTRPRAGASVAVGTRVSYVVAGAPRSHAGHGRRDARRSRAQRRPDGTFVSLPE